MRKRSAASSSMSELSASHWMARRLARASWKAYQAGTSSGYSWRSSSLNRAEGSLALEGPSRSLIGDCFGEVGHVLVPDPGRQRVDADQLQFLEVDRCLPVDAGVGCPERDLSGLRVDQPLAFVVGPVGQRSGDFLQIDAAQVKHHARIDPTARQYLRREQATRVHTPSGMPAHRGRAGSDLATRQERRKRAPRFKRAVGLTAAAPSRPEYKASRRAPKAHLAATMVW